MEQNKTGKYLKYAVGEIVLVVIGILIAISINNWNEERKALISENKLLLELMIDLEITKAELEVDIQDVKEKIELGVEILQIVQNVDAFSMSHDELDHLLNKRVKGGFLSNAGLFARTIAYQNLKSLGFEKFSNDSIRLITADIFDRKLVRIKEWESLLYEQEVNLNNLRLQSFTLYAAKSANAQDEFLPKDMASLSANRILLNGFANMQNTRRFILNVLYLDLLDALNNLIDLIEKELGSVASVKDKK